MGNMVVIAVRHSDLDAVNKLDFDTTSHMMNDFETIYPKFFDGRHAKNNRMMLAESYSGNVLFSGYYHASDNVNLIISNQLMTYLPSGLSFNSEVRKMKEGTNITRTLLSKMTRSIRESISFKDRGKKVSIRKSNSKKLKTIDKGNSYSLFGILTDCFHQVDKKTAFTTMTDAIKDMPWIDNESLICATNNDAIGKTPIVPLGNCQADQVALVSLSGNVFSLLALPNYGINIESINEKNETGQKSESRYVEIHSYTEVMKGIGYNVTLVDKSPINI